MAETEKKERKPTERVVLEELKIEDIVQNGEIQEDFHGSTVFIERGTGKGSKTKVVDDVVGKKEGTFRAPSLSSWRGAVAQDEEVVPESRQFRRRRVE